MTSPRGKSMDPEHSCVLCCQELDVYAIGKCDHPICYRCSTKMRVLCEQRYCAVCREELDKVVFVRKLAPFVSINTQQMQSEKNYDIYFPDSKAFTQYRRLLQHECTLCPELRPFHTFPDLEQHMRRNHELFCCKLCVKFLKNFTYERKWYTRKDLARHRIQGDPEDTSHRGHPLCKFCDERYLDNDELLKHLRRDHYFCHFCDSDGAQEYYSDYPFLREHFRESHFLCEEDRCSTEQFTHAFRTEIDYKAHKTSCHSKSRAEARQNRQIDLQFTYAPRQNRRNEATDVERLITEVREHPELWDTACDLYKDKARKASAWAEVARVVFPAYDSWSDLEQKLQTRKAIGKWRTVRDNYVRNLKKRQESARSGSGAKKPRSYIYAEQLTFLQRTLKPRTTVNSMDPSTTGSQEHQPMLPSASASCSVVVDQCRAESQLEEEDTTGQVPVTTGQKTGPASKRKKAAGGKFEQAILSFMEAHQPPPPPPRCMLAESEDLSFFYSCLPVLQRMSLNQKLEFRLHCLDKIRTILARPPHPPMSRSAVPEPHYAGGYYHHSLAQPQHPPTSPGAVPELHYAGGYYHHSHAQPLHPPTSPGAVPEPHYAGGYYHHSHVQPHHPPMSPDAVPEPRPDTEYQRRYMHGPHDPDAPHYEDL